MKYRPEERKLHEHGLKAVKLQDFLEKRDQNVVRTVMKPHMKKSVVMTMKAPR